MRIRITFQAKTESNKLPTSIMYIMLTIIIICVYEASILLRNAPENMFCHYVNIIF